MQDSKTNFTGKIAAALMQNNGTYFIARRAKKDGSEGLWEFPGGKQEEGETIQECLARELFEEFGIHVQVGDYLCSSFFLLKELPVEMCAFDVRTFTGTIVPNEHSEVKWVHPSTLREYSFTKPDLVFIEFIENL